MANDAFAQKKSKHSTELETVKIFLYVQRFEKKKKRERKIGNGGVRKGILSRPLNWLSEWASGRHPSTAGRGGEGGRRK